MYLYPNKIYNKTCQIFSKILYLQNFYLIDKERRLMEQINRQDNRYFANIFPKENYNRTIIFKIAIFIFIFVKNMNIVQNKI